MEFKDKLQTVRKDRGLSQEEAAERIGVSRQAVAKWESGQAYPDIQNLIALSDLLKVSLDKLLRSEANSCTTELTKQTNDDENAVAEFLFIAKKKTYAAHGKEEAVSSRIKSHDIKYEEGHYKYMDSYIGSSEFAGEEAVWYKNEPIWSMNYIGRVLTEPFSGEFLKEALMNVQKSKPYRGPMIYSNRDYHYHCTVNGELNWFQGYDEVFYEDKKVYECYFHGGRIK